MVLTGNKAPLGLHVGTRLVVPAVTELHLVGLAADSKSYYLGSHTDAKGGDHVVI